MPYLRRRYMTSWKGRSSPEAGSKATTSPSRITSRGPRPASSTSTTSGNCQAMRSRPPGEQLQPPVGGAVRLHPDAVVLVLGRAGSAELGEDLRGAGQPLGQHRPHRVAGPHLDPLHRGQPAARPGSRRPGRGRSRCCRRVPAPAGPAARRRAPGRARPGWWRCRCPRRSVAGHRADEVPGLHRGRPVEQRRQQGQLAPLRTRSGRGGDLVQRVEHVLDLQARRPATRTRRPAAARRPGPGRRSPARAASTCSAGTPAAWATARAASRSARPMSTPAKSGAIRPWHSSATVGSSAGGVSANSPARRSIISNRPLARSRSR